MPTSAHYPNCWTSTVATSGRARFRIAIIMSFRQKVESPGLSKRRFCAFDWPKRRSACLGLSSFWRNDDSGEATARDGSSRDCIFSPGNSMMKLTASKAKLPRTNTAVGCRRQPITMQRRFNLGFMKLKRPRLPRITCCPCGGPLELGYSRPELGTAPLHANAHPKAHSNPIQNAFGWALGLRLAFTERCHSGYRFPIGIPVYRFRTEISVF